ncbi:MAG: phosphoribosylaminoimidazolesuccinocarboxamide synthase [Candidatus Aenigmatarchaeota archaeon]
MFTFSDDYSVFDWGQMPDEIPGKGAALCMIGAYFFEEAEKIGVNTHYLGIGSEKAEEFQRLESVDSPSNRMKVNLVNVIQPRYVGGKYDYSAYVEKPKNVLIPLEVIYRNSLPPTSSVWRRLERGELTPEDMGLGHYPKPGERFDEPWFDYSTKLEPKDRYMLAPEAQRIARLSDEEFEEVNRNLGAVESIINSRVNQLGLTNEDGKIELAHTPDREVMVVDVTGTPDECRFVDKQTGLPLSKDVVRTIYKRTP